VPKPPADEDITEMERTQRDRDRALAEQVAQQVMMRILDAVQSDEVAERVISTWGGNMDRIIGRALRRLGFYVLIGLVALGAAKLGLLEKLAQLLKS
jgi:hypothetical protein